jgi:hypothetical protein
MMKTMSSKFSRVEKLCIIQYDETAVSEEVNYDIKHDMTLGPFKKAQFIQIKSIFAEWKQLIYCNFDKDMDVALMNEVVKMVYENGGYEVVATVSDNSTTNVKFWNAIRHTPDSNFFLHASTKEKIFMFSDAPHLLKLERNHLVDSGYMKTDGTKIEIDPILEIIRAKGSSPLFHLQNKHVEARGFQRQNVRLAAELLSQKTVTALLTNLPNSESARNTAEFVEICNNTFDVFNSTGKSHSNCLKMPYIGSDEQLDALAVAETCFEDIRRIKDGDRKDALLPFQRGLLLSISSLRDMFVEMKNRFGIISISTTQINNDALESIFSCIRDWGNDDTPGPVSILQRTKLLILCKNSMAVKKGVNVKDQNEMNDKHNALIGSFLKEMKNSSPVLQNEEIEAEGSASHQDTLPLDFDSLNLLEYDETDLKNFQSSIAAKLSVKFPWILASDGEISAKFVTVSTQLNAIFNLMYGQDIANKSNILQNLMQSAQLQLKDSFEELQDKAFLHQFFRHRLGIQLKHINAKIIESRKKTGIMHAGTGEKRKQAECSSASQAQKKLKRNSGNKSFAK